MIAGFNIHSLPPLFVSLIFLSVPLFVFLRNKESIVTRTFLNLGLMGFVWQFSYFIAYNLEQTSAILLWFKAAYLGVIFLPSATYHFIVSFLNLRKQRLIYLFYILSFIAYVSFINGDWAVKGVRNFWWGSRPQLGPSYTVFLIFWIIPPILALRYLYLEYKKAKSPYDKRRIKHFLITLPVVYLSTVDYLPNYGINIYPLGFIPLIFFGASTAYAIIRYKLMDIEIIIKKVSLIAVGFAVASSFIYIVAFYFQPYFYKLGGRNWIIFPVIISFSVGVGLFKFINFVRCLEEDELSKRFTYRPVLKKEAERISEARNMKELISKVTDDLRSWVKLDYVGIFVLDARNKRFILAKGRFGSKLSAYDPEAASLACDSPLAVELIRRKKTVVRSEIEYYLNTKVTLTDADEFSFYVASQMQKLGSEVVIPCFCEGRLLAIIGIGHKLDSEQMVAPEDLELISSLSNSIGRAVYGFMLKEEKVRLIVASQKTLISAIEAKDGCTRGHTDRVAKYTVLIGQRVEKESGEFPYLLSNLKWSSQLHDVGKLGIPDRILLKSGPLTQEEWQIVKEHPVNGIKIINSVRKWLGGDICAGILHHHENWDGTGYPGKQKGSQIHLFARIIRVADAFDAMTTDRPYRRGLSRKEAIEELNKYKAIYFDPYIVKVIGELYNNGEI